MHNSAKNTPLQEEGTRAADRAPAFAVLLASLSPPACEALQTAGIIEVEQVIPKPYTFNAGSVFQH
jgi:hypothetical protein